MSRTGVLAAVFLVGVLVTGCDQSATRVSTLWTNVPEMASYVERYNASQQEWQILVEYKEDPASLLTTPGRKADLVVARGLASTAVKDAMVPLDFLFDGGNLAKASFYRRVLDSGTQGDRTKLLPVSFDLPVLVFSPRNTPDLPGFSLDLSELRDQNARFSQAPNPKQLKRIAFSPRWERFNLTMLQLRDVGFQEGFQGTLTWDSSRLGDSLPFVQGWPSPGWDQSTDFRAKYLQSDPSPLLAAGRIQFYPSTLASFLSLPWEERRNQDFRYVDQGGRILATDDTVWAGIPSSSLTRGAAERFLAWFFQTETQKKLILEARAEDDRAFGLAQGLSALTTPSSTALVEAFGEMRGRVPGREQVSFWPTLPHNWQDLKNNVLNPWLEAKDASEASLKAALEKHQGQASRN